MKNTSNTPINSLNFDDIKSNLKQFLSGQEQFKDYNFEGSSLSVILDLLAYNTHYQAFYANMVAKEAFLDSASIRESAVSLAKHLDYTPRSIKASTGIVNVVFDENITDSVIRGQKFLPRGTTFRAKSETGQTLFFTALNSVKVVRMNGMNIAQNVELKQGVLKVANFIANTQEAPVPKFVLPDDNIDIDTITASVLKSSTDQTGFEVLWRRSTDITKVDSETPVFFVQQGRGSAWEVYFGDGTVGKAIENGNLVSFTYLTTDGPAGNGIGLNDSEQSRTFIVSSFPGTTTSAVIYTAVTVDSNGIPYPSFGGRNPEDVKSIKYYAPRSYQAQERAVTANDYLAILGRDYSDRADSFFVWGGEENDPPEYGKVFISIKPKIGSKLSLQEKKSIEKTILQERNLVTIAPEVVDPDVIYITPNISVRFDEAKTQLNSESYARLVSTFVAAYNEEELGKFSRSFNMSRLLKIVDSVSPASISSNIELSLAKDIDVNLSNASTYNIPFDNSIYHPLDGYTPVIESDSFGYPYSGSNRDSFLEDDGYGNIRIYTFILGGKTVVKKNAGKVDYAKGLISLVGFSPKYLDEGKTQLRITVKPTSNDIFVRRNQILEIEGTNVVATPVKSRMDRNTTDSNFGA